MKIPILNKLVRLRAGLWILLFFVFLPRTLVAHPNSALPCQQDSYYHQLANVQLEELQGEVMLRLKTQSSDEKIQALQRLGEIQIAKNQFHQAYQTFLNLFQREELSTPLAQRLQLKEVLSETALLSEDLPTALDWRIQFLEDAQSLGWCAEEAWAHKRLGRLFWQAKQFERAKEQFELAIQQYDKLGDASMVLALRQEWGLINLRKRNYLSAINCFVRNLEEQVNQEDTLGIMSSLKHLVEIHESLGEPAAVESYCHEIIKWAKEPQYHIWQSGAYLKLGQIEEERNNIALAKEYYLHNQHLLLGTTAQPQLLHTLRAKRPVYQMIGDFDLPIGNRQVLKDNRVFPLLLFWIRLGAFDQVQAVLDHWIGQREDTSPTIRTTRLAYRIQTESYRNQARFSEAVHSFRQLLEDQRLAPPYDPLLNKFMDLQAEAKESHEKLLLLFENQEQQQLIEQSVWQKRSLLAAIFLALLLSGFLFYTNQQRKQNNLLLNKKNEVIAEALEEKEMLIREVHHRVKNNLQVVSSLLNLQARRLEDPQIMSAIREGRDRVKSMAFIHQKLYQVADVRQMEVSDYIDNLTNYLFTSYQVDPQQIQLTTQIQNVELDVDMMVPLGLMLNEMISNALKHAFPNGKRGQISVYFQEKAKAYLLEVCDTGVGVPQQVMAGERSGFGYQLIQTFCKKLKGQIEIQNQLGTRIQFRFPKGITTAA